MTDAAGLDLDSYPSGLWFRNFPLHDLKRSLRVRDLRDTHFFAITFSIVLFFLKNNTNAC